MSVYVMSDIHGHFDRFLLMLNKINLKKDDKVYILGDVIDRGPCGIDILKYIIQDDRFTLIIGNHEKMMLDYYDEIKKDDVDFYFEEVWFINGSTPTRQAFDILEETQQNIILQYLKKCPIAISDLKVKDKCYYLVHGSPDFKLTTGTLYYDSLDVSKYSIHSFVWERVYKGQRALEDRCIIFGHTMTFFYQTIHPYQIWSDNEDLMNAKWIGLDCGCAKNDIYSRLAALRLDDMQVFYV